MEKRKNKEKQILKSYLREHLKTAAGYLAGILIFFVIAALYGYGGSVRKMSYAVLVAVFFGGCFLLWDYVKYRKKCLALFHAADSGGDAESLPEPKSLPETLYYRMVNAAGEERRTLTCELDAKKRDMADYYTMWTHQIKTPIAALRLLLLRERSGAVEKTAEEEEEKGREQALKELFKIEQYTEMALHYARLDSMSADLLFVEHDIRALISHAVKKYASLFIGSRLSFSLADFECTAVTDEKWLSFVLEQVLSNALKYTPEGGIRVYGADETGKERKGRVSFVAIEDTGIGIKESDLPRIFERGFTGYNGRMDKRSTGIGLYLSRQIMDRLSHTIRAESVQGQGTKVILGFLQEERRETCIAAKP